MWKRSLLQGTLLLCTMQVMQGCKERSALDSEQLAAEPKANPEVKPALEAKPFNSEINETNRYLQGFQQLGQRKGAFTDAVGKWTQSVHVIIVPGLGANAIRKLAAATVWKLPGGKKLVSDYMTDTKAALEESGISYEIVPTNTEASVLTNGAMVYKRILAATKPVVLIGHSKGGLDALEALISLTPEQRKTVKGFLALQSPLQGIPLQDMLRQSRVTRTVMDLLLIMIGGEAQANVDITMAARAHYLTYYQDAIAQLLHDIPVVAAASYKMNEERFHADTVFELTRNFMLDTLKLQNDGVVPVSSVKLPGAPYLWIPGSDHISSVMTYQGAPDVDRKALIKTLLQILGENSLGLRPG